LSLSRRPTIMGNHPDKDGISKESDPAKPHKHRKKDKHRESSNPKKEDETTGEYKSFVENLENAESLGHDVKDDINKFYDITSKVLGVGNFSVVKLAINKKTSERCAIKIVDKSAAKNKPEMLVNEVNILLKVHHPNIIKLKDLFDTSNTLYLVMELITGGELFDKIVEREQYCEKDAVKVMEELFSAIDYLHSLGIVHRDLKPENLLLANEKDDSPIKLADFGLSRLYTEEMLSTACGTPGYVAPEILECQGYDKEVDTWSAGVIMYILLCGYPPFYDENEPTLFETILAGKYEFHSPYWDNISEQAKDLIKHLLVVDPKKRLTPKQALQHDWFKEGKHKKNFEEHAAGIHIGFAKQLSKHNTFRKDKTEKTRTTYALKSKEKKEPKTKK